MGWAAVWLAGVAAAADLVAVEGCTLVAADWADGDSFPVRTPDGEVHTVRLYAADCLEQHVSGETDARRLRSQRRYFGITSARPDAAASIALAKDLARQATAETRRFLTRPFTIHTSFADARGDGRHKRIYAFVFDAAGRDLAAHLVGPTPTGPPCRRSAAASGRRRGSWPWRSTGLGRRRASSSRLTRPRGRT